MFNLIPISLLIMAMGGIIYIISNHLSEFNNDEENGDNFQFKFKARFVEWVNQLPLDSVKNQSLSFTQKLLHRFRLALLKTDNHLMKLIGKISERGKMVNGNGKGNDDGNDDGNGNTSDFWEELAKKKNEEQIVMPVVEPEAKIDFAVKSEAAKKFFDIQPAKISSEISDGESVKKTLKTKKSKK